MTAGTHPQAMPPRAILREAKALLEEHGYGHVPVKINNRMTKTYGQVRYSAATDEPVLLEVSGPLARANDRWRTMECIRHEVAHVLAPYGSRHGPEWVRACAVVGAKPERCYDLTDTAAAGRYVGLCAGCGDVVGSRARAPRRGSRFSHGARGGPCGCPPGTAVHFADRRSLTPKEQERIMPKHYRYVVTDPVGIEHTDTRARKGDAIKAAQRTAEKEGGVRWVVYTPGGDVAEEWGEAATPPPPPDDEPMADVVPIRKAAAPAEDKAYRRDRIPAGATEHPCTTCGRTLPVSKFPTTRDKSRLTECRACRDEKRALARK